jgi:hypothetical protein
VRRALVLVVAFLVGLGIAIPATSAAGTPTDLDKAQSYDKRSGCRRPDEGHRRTQADPGLVRPASVSG